MSKPEFSLRCPHCDNILHTRHPSYGLNEHRELLLAARWQQLKRPPEVACSPLQFGDKPLLTSSYLRFGALDFLSVWRIVPMLEFGVVAFKARYARLYGCSACNNPLSLAEAKKQPAATDEQMR